MSAFELIERIEARVVPFANPCPSLDEWEALRRLIAPRPRPNRMTVREVNMTRAEHDRECEIYWSEPLTQTVG